MIKTFLQQENSDCGICCLETIINYYGGYVPLEVLRIETRTNEFGTSAYNLINCAKKYGFNCKGIKTNDLECIKLPAIAHFKVNDLYHFVVIYKITNKFIYIVDPAIGKVKYSIEKFNEYYTGIILELIPYTKIPKLSKNMFLNNLLKNELKGSRKVLIKIFIFNFIILVFSLLISLEIKLLKYNNLYLVIFLVIILFNEFLIFLKNKIIIMMNNKINNNLIKRFVTHIFKLPSNYLTLKNNGEIVTRFNELDDLSNNIISLVINILFNVFLILFLIVIFLSINIYIGLFIFIFSILILIFNYCLYKKVYPIFIDCIKNEENYKSIILDFINKIDIIKNINFNDYFINKISLNNKLKNKQLCDLNIKINKIINAKNLILNIFNLLFIYAILKVNSINDSLLLIILFNYLISVVNIIIEFFPTIFYIKSIFYKTSEFMGIIEKNSDNYIKKFKQIKIVNFENLLNFNSIFNPISIKINNKDKILIKGKSGIGKSTFVKTLVKINNNYKGSIYIDDYNLKNIGINSLISYTSQNETLFYDTIKNNIVLNRNIDDNLLKDIIKITRVTDIKIVKEYGLDSLILNNSFNISGGEKNRIILARSLLSNNEIIILDEVLSQVDFKLENDILKDLLEYFKNKTIIYISHRNVSPLFNKVINLNERSINGIN